MEQSIRDRLIQIREKITPLEEGEEIKDDISFLLTQIENMNLRDQVADLLIKERESVIHSFKRAIKEITLNGHHSPMCYTCKHCPDVIQPADCEGKCNASIFSAWEFDSVRFYDSKESE